MNEVEIFISKFQSLDNTALLKDCSYWFAVILYRRFIRDGSEIMFCRAEKHFGTRMYGRVYDVTGDVTEKYKWGSWLNEDPSLKREITEEYIMF